MARVKGGTVTRNRRKKVLKLAKGYFGSKHLLYKTAHEQVMHSLKYAYNDRKDLKKEMRKLWHGLKLANIKVNRKMLSEIAIHDPKGFANICDKANKALEKAK